MHKQRIIDALGRYADRPAVESPADQFEAYVNAWYSNQALIAEIKALLKPLEAEEREQRDSIATSMRSFFGSSLKEGVNTYALSNKRKLKFGHKVSRTIETDAIAQAREHYAAAKDGHNGVAFDALLRAKYEPAMASLKKLQGPAKLAASMMITTKFAAPEVKVD